ncbi:MAG: gamma-glutamyl-gamma-aminobutyrate hydrolase family protein [Sphaerobacter sp.]|nr:gamma-glutamyl-gamma-aminobutyrate hydrolase family protein [Sphaerobacter sp.]
MKPIIGITPSIVTTDGDRPERRYTLATTYSDAVDAAGGVPIILPYHEGSVERILDIVDGLVLSGGADLRPDRYGDTTVHPTVYGIDDLRDSFEVALVERAIARGVPILGICRGCQVLNVALGGTLIQDIPDQHGTTIEHRQSERTIPPAEPSHSVSVESGSLLETVYGATSLATNSFHHQAIRDIAPSLRLAGRAPDGIVEAVWRPGPTWVLGLQWHPELMFRAHPEHLRPFQALVAAARAAGRSAAVGS